jgi:multiple sugar transport system permease protein
VTTAAAVGRGRVSRTRRWRQALEQAGRHAALIGVGGFFFLPWFWMVSTSLKPLSQVFKMPPQWIPNPVAWENYKYAVTAVPLLHYLRNTLFISTTAVIGQIIASSLVAYAFGCIDWKGRDKVFLLVLATMMLPGQVTMIPVFVIWNRLGGVNTYLPLTVPAFFGSAFWIFMLRQFFRTIPTELRDAAVMDGCSEFRIYWQIVMPLSRPALATLIVFTFLGSYTDFMGPLIYLSDKAKWTLSLGLWGFIGTHSAGWSWLMAASVLFTLPMVILFFFTQKTFVRGIATTGFR